MVSRFAAAWRWLLTLEVLWTAPSVGGSTASSSDPSSSSTVSPQRMHMLCKMQQAMMHCGINDVHVMSIYFSRRKRHLSRANALSMLLRAADSLRLNWFIWAVRRPSSLYGVNSVVINGYAGSPIKWLPGGNTEVPDVIWLYRSDRRNMQASWTEPTSPA